MSACVTSGRTLRIVVAVGNDRVQRVVGEDALEVGRRSRRVVQSGRQSHDGIRGRIPRHAQPRLPLGQIVGDASGLRNRRIRMVGLRIPLRIPAQAGSERQCLAQRQLGIDVEAELLHGAVVDAVADDKRLLIAPWIIGQEVGQRIEVEAAIEIGLVPLPAPDCRRTSPPKCTIARPCVIARSSLKRLMFEV